MNEATETAKPHCPSRSAGGACYVRPFLPGQNIQYYTLMGLEADRKQACHIRGWLAKNYGVELTTAQIGAALQRAKRDGLARYDGAMWHRAHNDLLEPRAAATA